MTGRKAGYIAGALTLLLTGAFALGCRRSAPVATAPAATQLTPDPPPLCGELGRPYLAPGSTGQTQPSHPPPGFGTLGAIESRVAREGAGFQSYSPEDQALIRTGRARPGLDERAVYLANGLPAFYWNTQIEDASCRVMLYGILGEPEVDTAIYTCNGKVSHIAPVQPRLPCWRLQEVAPRAIERADHFDRAGVERQWELLQGLLRRGQTLDDVYVSFGEPYRTGLEAREDGTNADEHVYLDSTGDAYASYFTFVDGVLRGWRFPADRRLTAEAEQRRLDALERRMVQQMRAIEEASIARHQEEMTRLGAIQSNQARIRADIESSRTAILEQVAQEGESTRDAMAQNREAQTQSTNPGSTMRRNPNAGQGGSGQNGSGNRRTVRRETREVRGCQRLLLNGTLYTDHFGTPFRRRCDQEGAPPCPGGYACLLPFRICVPDDPEVRCQ